MTVPIRRRPELAISVERHRKLLLRLLVATSVFSIGHHADHLVRGNHVGWPITSEFTPFTVSLFVYVPIALGFFPQRRGRVGARYWFVLTSFGFIFIVGTHLVPGALEPPRDIVDAYSFRAEGWVAFAWLLGFLGSLLLSALCSAWLAYREAAAS